MDFGDDLETVTRAIVTLINHVRTRVGVWLDTGRIVPGMVKNAAALDAAYRSLAQAGANADEALAALARARGRADAPGDAPERDDDGRDWTFITDHNAAASVDLRRVDAVHLTALRDDLHAAFVLPGGRVYLRLGTDAGETLLDELYAARLIQARQRDELRRGLREGGSDETQEEPDDE